MEHKPAAQPISLIRTTPPTPPWLGEEVARAFDLIRAEEDLSTLMRIHKFTGTEDDKTIAADWLSRRFGEKPASDRFIMTNGAQNALFIALNHVVGRGNVLLVEKLGYYGLRNLARLLGIEVVAVEMDEEGAEPDAVEALCRKLTPKALFLTPTLHNPTTTVMPPARRAALVQIARRHGLAIIEDDVYGMLAQGAPPPFAVTAPDVTWHATSPAKCVAPGLRIGYLVAPDAVQAAGAFKPLETTSTWFASPLSAALMKHWVRSGAADRLFTSIRDEAIARQKLAGQILKDAPLRTHPDSLFLWLSLPDRFSNADFVKAVGTRQVTIRPGTMFAVDPDFDPKATRIVLGSPQTREELSAALGHIAQIIHA